VPQDHAVRCEEGAPPAELAAQAREARARALALERARATAEAAAALRLHDAQRSVISR
jgi:hypothetical protein